MRIILIFTCLTFGSAYCYAQGRVTKAGQPFCGEVDDLAQMTMNTIARGTSHPLPESCMGLKAGLPYRIRRFLGKDPKFSVVEVEIQLPGNDPMLAYTYEILSE